MRKQKIPTKRVERVEGSRCPLPSGLILKDTGVTSDISPTKTALLHQLSIQISLSREYWLSIKLVQRPLVLSLSSLDIVGNPSVLPCKLPLCPKPLPYLSIGLHSHQYSHDTGKLLSRQGTHEMMVDMRPVKSFLGQGPGFEGGT